MEKLVFVYNADSGRLKALMDSFQKAIKPSSYSCKLCELTYGTLGEKSAWKKFREELPIEADFLHKDEFQKQFASKFGHKFEFPIILVQTANGLEVLISNFELSEINSLEILMDKIRAGMKTYQ